MTKLQGVSDIFHRALKTALAACDRVALAKPDGTAVLIESDHPADLATLPQAAAACFKYLKLGHGEFALANDPYSGGTSPNEYTLVRGLTLKPAGSREPLALLIATRFAFVAKLPFTGRLDEEGVRVPPTPLSLGPGQLNHDLLSAIAMHPLAPQGLKESVLSSAERLDEVALRLTNLANDPKTLLSEKVISNYLDDSRLAFESLMTRFPLGTTIVTGQTSTGETVKLSLKLDEDRAFFDFGGTDFSPRFAITDLATFGACWSALVGAFHGDLPLNSGSFQHVQVSAPQKTMFSAAHPVGTSRGIAEGIGLVASLVRQALIKMRTSLNAAPASLTQAVYQLEFQNRVLSLSLLQGTGATVDLPGCHACGFGYGSDFAHELLMKLEGEPAVEVQSFGVRLGPSGNAKKPGGKGLAITLKLNEPCKLKWFDAALGERFDGLQGGRSGSAAMIEIQSGSGKDEREQITEKAGERALTKGQTLSLLGSGGGGFGEPTEKDEESLSKK